MLQTRRYRPTTALGSRAYRASEIDRVVLAGFVPGRPAHPQGRRGPAALLGPPVSLATVGHVAKILDAAAPSPTAARPSCPTAWCWRVGSAPPPTGVPFRSPLASSWTGARGSSTSNPPARERRRMGVSARLPPPARPHRRRPRNDPRGWRQRPPRRALPSSVPASPYGPQDREHPNPTAAHAVSPTSGGTLTPRPSNARATTSRLLPMPHAR